VNNRRKIQLLIAGATTAVLVIVAVPFRKGEATVFEVPPRPPIAVNTRTSPIDTERAEKLEGQKQRSLLIDWGRDPFLPPAEATETTPHVVPQQLGVLPKLTGISRVGDEHMAVIDRQIVKEGDRLRSGHTVGPITELGVTLSLSGVTLSLSLGDE